MQEKLRDLHHALGRLVQTCTERVHEGPVLCSNLPESSNAMALPAVVAESRMLAYLIAEAFELRSSVLHVLLEGRPLLGVVLLCLKERPEQS